MKIYLSLLSILLSLFSLQAQNFAGNWQGLLNAGGQELQLVFHIKKAADGFSTTIDSPDQNAFGLAMQQTKIQNDSITIKANFMEYQGQWKNDTISGIFIQNGMQFPLQLTKEKSLGKSKDTAKSKRPQTPKAPFSYTVKEVSFYNAKDSIQLAGTLTLPKSKRDFPTLILLTGSGPQDRDETIMGHKPFLVLADFLTKNGIAVLRFDDRGTAKSEGDFMRSDAEDFVNDATAAVNFLKNHPQINNERIGVLGHSEGGLVGSMLAAESKVVAFLVLLAAPGVSGKKLLLTQLKDIAIAQGSNPMALAPQYNFNQKAFDIIINTSDTKVREALVTYFEEQGITSESQIEQLLKQFNLPFLKYLVRSQPSNYLEKIKIPVLALNGEKDMQVNAEENLSAIQTAMQKAGNKQLTVKRYKDLNHLFQTAETGLPKEYGKIEETIAAQVLEDIKKWILNLQTD